MKTQAQAQPQAAGFLFENIGTPLNESQAASVSGGRWYSQDSGSSAACTGDGSRCGSQQTSDRTWIG